MCNRKIFFRNFALKSPGVFLFIVSAILLSSCAGAAPQPVIATEAAPTAALPISGRGSGDTLRILDPQAPEILNPHLSAAIKDGRPSRIVYEPLASFDKDGVLVAILAAEVPSLENGGVASDGKSVTWKLRRDVQWSDGESFTADDVVFTYQFVIDPATNAATAPIYNGLDSVIALDPYTLRIDFKKVTPGWASPFVGTQGIILPKHIFEEYKGAAAHEAPANKFPVGTGPYRVIAPGIKPQEVLLLGSRLVPTNKIVFEPNPYYREKDKPYFSRVEWRGGGTSNEAARQVLQDGQVDFAYGLGQLAPEVLVELEKDGKGKLVVAFGSAVDRLLLNRADPRKETADGETSSLQFPHPFFSDKKVRQAFSYAIDRDAIAEAYGPAGRPVTNNLVAPPQYNSPHVFYEYNLEKAKSLLDESGWIDTNEDGIRDKDGQKMQVVYQTYIGASVQKTQQIIKKSLEAIGVEVKLEIIDPAILFSPGDANPQSAPRFNADIQEFDIRSVNPDPNDYMQFWQCDRIPKKENNWGVFLNFERWCSPEYDDLYQQTTLEIDPEKRAALFIQMNDLQIEDVVMIPLVLIADVQGVNASIEGLDVTPWDADTWNIQDWRRVSP